MLQKEVVMRLASPSGSKDYGRLSVMVQYLCEVDYLLDVPPGAFFPVPKVDSAVVRLRPYKIPVFPKVDLVKFEKLLALAFSMRRKTLANNLKSVISADLLKHIDIDPGLRPEQISVQEYVTIANHIAV
jgi:16S rRNA (adenine1518-N6/adenine1519-N6)-dimethyltransferase